MNGLPYKTSLNETGRERDLLAAKNSWARGIDWVVFKQKRGWIVHPCFGNTPIFKTKKAAYDFVTNLVLAASRYELSVRNGLPVYS